MKVYCHCGGVLRRPLPPKCPHCGALVVGARRHLLQTIVSLAVAAILVLTLIGTLFVLVKYFANPAPEHKPKPDRSFEQNLK